MPRTTVVIDDKLLARAKEFSGIKTTKGVIETALQEFVQRAAVEKLLALRGSGIVELTNEEIEALDYPEDEEHGRWTLSR